MVLSGPQFDTVSMSCPVSGFLGDRADCIDSFNCFRFICEMRSQVSVINLEKIIILQLYCLNQLEIIIYHKEPQIFILKYEPG